MRGTPRKGQQDILDPGIDFHKSVFEKGPHVSKGRPTGEKRF